MYEIWVIARNHIRKTFRNRVIYFLPIIMIVSSIGYLLNYRTIVGDATAQDVYNTSLSYLNTILFLWPLTYCLLANYVGSSMLILEKTARNFEPLMVTPVSIRQIWIGKSLGMAIVSVILGLGLSVLVFLGMSFGLVIPQTGVFVVPDILPIITAIIIAPALVFGVMLLGTYFQLVVSNPRTAAIVYVFVVVAVVFGMLIATLKVTNFNYYPFIYLGLIAIIGAVLCLISHSLTTEKVVLSSKG
jgi:ABC-2 type transport system permease protein